MRIVPMVVVDCVIWAVYGAGKWSFAGGYGN